MKRVLGNRGLSEWSAAALLTLCLVLFVAACNSGYSAPPPDTTPPSAPTGLTATAASSSQINLAWTASTDYVGVTGYRVESCSGANCSNFTQIATPTTTTFNNTGLAASTSYSYRVRATDAAGNLSGFSATSSATTSASPDTTPPTTPSNLAAAAASATQINLSWTASTDNVGVTGYRVESCSGANCSNFAQIATPTGTTFSNTSLTASTSYSYRVRAADAANNLSGFSNTATTSTQAAAPISVSISPKRAAIAVGQTQTYVATVSNDSQNLGVTWAVDTILGGNAATLGTIDANGKYIPPTSGTIGGTHTITATSKADITKNATASVAVTDLTGVFTYHNDLSRHGANTHEFALTPASVKTATFGKLFVCTVDGAIYAQPLWIANLMIGGAKHNVVIVATQRDSVYAFDADTNANPCVALWHANLVDTAHGGTAGETFVSSSLVGSGFGDLAPDIGITGTPVIDPATNTLYLVSKSAKAGPQFFQRLHALDLTSGNEKLNGNKPALISASVLGDGDGSSGGSVAFDPRNEHQRPGLALVNGVVYIAWASHEDHDPYHGWVIGYDAATLAQVSGAVFNTTPNLAGTVSYSRGGIWMGGGAPAADTSNNLYVITGNGVYDSTKSDFGDSVLKLATSGGLSLADWFTPNDQMTLDQNDTDFGSGAAVILVDLPSSPTPHLVVGGGKEGTLFVLNRDNLGHITPGDGGAIQFFPASNGIFATPAFWQNKLYYAADSDTLKAFTLDPVQGLFTPIAGPSASSQSSNSFGFPGATPSISSQGAANGIVWALNNGQFCTTQSPGCGPAVLHAYDATNLVTELWNSSQVAADKAGNAVKFTVPTVANGKVYIGTRGSDSTSGGIGELDVYGLKPN